jgi:hypothetical protein
MRGRMEGCGREYNRTHLEHLTCHYYNKLRIVLENKGTGTILVYAFIF